MTNQTTTNIFTSPTAATAVLQAGEKLVTYRWKNPARSASIAISWPSASLETIPTEFRPLIEGVLMEAAKSILCSYCAQFGMLPSTVPASLFTLDKLLEGASTSTSTWLSKEELEREWQASATRARIMQNPKYRESANYRRAATQYSELLLKMSGKTSSYTLEQLDWLVAKLDENDLETPLGTFVLRRVESLRNKPVEDLLCDEL